MTGRSVRKRKAWVLTIGSANPPAHPDVFDRFEPGQVLAVLPSRTPSERVAFAVDALVQTLLFNDPEDQVAWLTRDGAPYRAERHNSRNGTQVMGGHNPYIEAFVVEDLRVTADPETGRGRFEFTRPTAS